MRKIRSASIFCALLIVTIVTLLTLLASWQLYQLIPPHEFRAIIVTAFFVFLLFFLQLGTYRLLWSRVLPIPTGPILPGTQEEFNYEVCTLIQLMFFSPLSRALPFPVPLSRLFFKWMGAQIGENTYTGGTITDPCFVKIGANCLLGHHSLLVPHALEGSKISHERIEIGNNVTVGACSIVLAGCKMGDGSVLGMNSVLTKGTVVGPKEIWAGSPAKFIKKMEE